MKTRIAIKIILFLSVLFCTTACTTEEVTPQSSERVTEIVAPIYGQNGFIERISSRYYAKIQWLTTYDFPTFQPHYCTIYRNGVLVRDFVDEPNNVVEILLPKRTTKVTYTITQTVIGIGTSEPVTLTIYN
jgi:hypothetical protein